MKIIFMGTPNFAVPSLQNLVKSEHEVVAVFTSPPKPQGRGLKLLPTPVHEIANQFNIPVYTPKTLRSQETIDLINIIDAHIIVVVAYGFIVPKDILLAKKFGCLNVHPSKLPRYRGAAPLQRTIINGDKETSVCIMQMDEGLDTGDIILQEDVTLPDNITLEQLHDKCSQIGAQLLIQTLDNIVEFPRVKQSEIGIVYANKLSKEEGLANWTEAAYQIDCKVRGMNPWPGVYFEHNGNIIKILESQSIKVHSNNELGMVLNEDFDVSCADGALRILRVKPAGKQEMSGKDYLRGLKEITYPCKI